MAKTKSCCPDTVDPTASLGAELGILALIAHVRWPNPANQQELAALPAEVRRSPTWERPWLRVSGPRERLDMQTLPDPDGNEFCVMASPVAYRTGGNRAGPYCGPHQLAFPALR